MMSGTLREKIFVSYAHADEQWLTAFMRMLRPAVDTGILDVWSDRRIGTGAHWREEIQRALTSAHVALLLVTDSFLASDFITRHELPAILSAARSRGLSVHWVPVSASLHELTPLKDFHACWDPKRPLACLEASERDQAVRDICWDVCSKLGQASRVNENERDELRAMVESVLPCRVRLEEVVGSGGYSIVYRASVEGRPIAVKAMVDSPLHRRTAANFIEHSRRAMNLKHPVFISVHDVLLDARPQCLLMEYVEGEALASRIERRGALKVDEAVSILRELCEALAEAHEHRLVYGAMKSTDVFVQNNNVPRISAYGFWTFLAKEEGLAAMLPFDKEAVSYQTPEHYHGQPVTTKTDQYALALLALEMLDGRRPMTVRRPADFEQVRAFFADPLAGQGRWKDRHPALAEILGKMLAENPGKRWSSLAAVNRALSSLEDEAVALAKGSYRRACAGRSEFYRAFYARLFARSPDIEPLFDGRDMSAQFRMLDAALQALLNFRDDHLVEPTVLTAVADRHRHLPLEPRHFDDFCAALLETLAETVGEDVAALTAWEQTVGPGIAYMKARCTGTQAAPEPPLLPLARSAG